jgi:septum site-determining protein MinD|tara:strand:- start:835 stop:1668 length:834 start_codon:yes stop_codon:yes gene_type:complete
MSKGKTIGIISLKGGVGKTSSVSNLGAALASEFGKEVLVVDANFTSPNLGLHLGVVEPAATLHDVLLDKIDIAEAIYEHESGFHFIPGAYISRKIQPFKLKKKIEHLKEHYDMILLDSSPNLNEEILSTMIASDELLVVTSPDYPTLSTTLRAVRLAKQKKTPITGLILNRVRNKKFELKVEDIEEAAQVPVLSVLPEDINVLESVAHTTPVALHKPKANASIEYKKLAACLIGEQYKDPRLWSKVKSMFKKGVTIESINRLLIEKEMNLPKGKSNI